MTTKEQLKEYLRAYKKDYAGVEDILNDYDTRTHIKDFCYYIEQEHGDIDFQISIDLADTDSDSYTMATYYSLKLCKPVIIEWNVKDHFETEEEIINTIYELNKEAFDLEAKIIIK